jgi:transposase
MTMKRRIDVNLDELDQIIDRSTRAPLSESEGQKLKTALHAMAERLVRKRNTEKTSAVLPDAAQAGKPETDESAPAGHGRKGAAAFTGANKVAVAHATLHSGDLCPECRRGKVYCLKEPATQVRFVGHAPLEATVFEMERLRCNACGEVFTAEEPETAGADKYDETAVAMIALLKYGTGVPFKRLERLQEHLGMPLPATTQWDLMAAAAKLLWPVLVELIRQAAQGSVMHNDDTGMRILRLAREPGDKRTGTFTSGIVSMVGAWTVALFFTGWKHAGENLAEVLKQRARELPAPIQMSDALSRNSPKVEGVEPLQANCLAHGRRQVVEVADNFPEECRYVLETLRDVYHHDAQAREQAMSPEQRLGFHQEPNSGLGKAISYLLNHWLKLTLFLRQAGAPIDNNIVERALKRAILNRKNALFYKTLNGAAVGDLFMSLIHTCELNKANPFDYLTELQKHSEELKQKPAEWMPWNYRETLARLATSAAA